MTIHSKLLHKDTHRWLTLKAELHLGVMTWLQIRLLSVKSCTALVKNMLQWCMLPSGPLQSSVRHGIIPELIWSQSSQGRQRGHSLYLRLRPGLYSLSRAASLWCLLYSNNDKPHSRYKKYWLLPVELNSNGYSFLLSLTVCLHWGNDEWKLREIPRVQLKLTWYVAATVYQSHLYNVICWSP